MDKFIINGDNLHTIMGALHVAAEEYDKHAKTALPNVRIHDQFCRQAADARSLHDALNNAERIAISAEIA